MDLSLHALRDGYIELWDTTEPLPSYQRSIEELIRLMLESRARYETVSKLTGVPWFLIACLHSMECSLRFDQHLHNGDSLRFKTHHVPAGRPSGDGPWTWEESAADALHVDRLDTPRVWEVPACLHAAESYNGWGYRKHGVNSPYLWGGSTAAQPGKYVADGRWDAHAITHQVGVATLLIAMDERDLITFPERS